MAADTYHDDPYMAPPPDPLADVRARLIAAGLYRVGKHNVSPPKPKRPRGYVSISQLLRIRQRDTSPAL
jgi:hypothetical protein